MVGMIVQLVVDVMGFVVFGVEYVQIVGFDDFGGFFGDDFFYCFVCFVLCDFVFFGCFDGVEIFVFEFLYCEEFGVFIEYDVGFMIGYVGCDGYCIQMFGVGYDFCFVGVVFCVEYFVFDVFFGEQL